MEDRITKIEKCLDELLRITKGFDNIKCAKDDFLKILLVAFYQRLMSHLKSIRSLKESRDHLLVARSVIECGAILTWILEPEDLIVQKQRATRYFDLYLVTMKERLDAQAEKANPAHKEAIKKMLIGTQNLLSPKEYNDLMDDKPESFVQFFQRLTGVTLGEYIKNNKKLDRKIYTSNYNFLGGYHHWSVFHLFVSIDQDGHIVLGKTDAGEYELSLMAELIVIAETAKRLSFYSELGKEKEIFDLVQNLIQSLGKRERS